MTTQTFVQTTTDKEQASPSKVLHLPNAVLVGDFENILAKFYLANDPLTEDIVFDMRRCTYIEVASLMRLISLFSDRQRKGLRTQIALPLSKDVRDFLRVWGFPNALFQATQLPFYEVVPKEDHRHFGENKNPSDIKYTTFYDSLGTARLLSNRFFSFLATRIKKGDSITSTVVKESMRWQDDLVMSILRNHLSGPDNAENYVPSRIIYEAMSNACRHPNCSLIITTSRFSYSDPSAKDPTGQFTIVVWDDGESMMDTLKRPLVEGKSIRAIRPILNQKFLVKFVDLDGKESEEVYPTDFLPTADSKDYLVLFATMLPGITRDPAGTGHTVHPELLSVPELTLPGMGLYVLLNTVIDIFGGSVAFRTNRFFMNLGRPKKQEIERFGTEYKAKIQQFSETLPPFLGNMITIRLPIRKEAK